jgi:hypothetical protein
MGPGEHLFQQAASMHMLVGPFTVRPDGIRDDHEARQYMAQVVGIIRGVEATSTGNALITAIRSYHRPVLIFPLVPSDEDDPPDANYAWTYPRMGLFSVVVSFSPLFGQRLRRFAGDDDDDGPHVFTPHEVIVHELVHVARDVSGNFHRLGEDEEELAVMIADIFAVEINRRPIKGYTEMFDVKGDLTAFSRKWYQENFEIIEAFCEQNKKLAYELSYVKTAFNPLRLYIEENL